MAIAVAPKARSAEDVSGKKRKRVDLPSFFASEGSARSRTHCVAMPLSLFPRNILSQCPSGTAIAYLHHISKTNPCSSVFIGSPSVVHFEQLAPAVSSVVPTICLRIDKTSGARHATSSRQFWHELCS
jgi:hypothetical protein